MSRATFLMVFIFLFLPQFLVSVLNEIEEHDVLFENCLNLILKTYFRSTDFVIVLDEDGDLRLKEKPIVYQTDHKKSLIYFKPPKKADGYIIKLSDANVVSVFSSLVRSFQWNPRGKFILIFKENPSDVLWKILYKYFIYNVVVFILENGDWVLLSYFPFNYRVEAEMRRAPILMDVCQNGTFLKHAYLFPNKLPNDWRNFTFRLSLMEYPPYMVYLDENKTLPSGIEHAVFLEVQNIVGFNVVYLRNANKSWGNKLPDGSYTGFYGDLRDYNTEAAIGLFYLNFSEKWDFDLSYPYMEDSCKWAVATAGLQGHWDRIVKIFRWIIWATLTFAVFTVPPLLYFIHKLSPEENTERNMTNFYLICLGSLLSQGISYTPKATSIRMILTSWLILNCILANSFQSKLFVTLNSNHFVEQISDTDEMIAAKFRFFISPFATYLFTDPSSKKDSYILKHYIPCLDTRFCLDSVARNGKFATFKSRRFLLYEITHRYLDPKGRSSIYIFHENVYNVLIGMAFVRGFPLLEKIDNVLMNLRSNGFIQHFYDRVEFLVKKTFSRAKKIELNADALSLIEVQGIFIILILGLSISFIVFLSEYLFRCYRRNACK